MNQDFDIRIANEDDELKVRECAKDAYHQYVATIGHYIPPMVADFRSLIASHCVYVASEGLDKLLGYIVFYQRDDHVFLENIAVHTHSIGRGIGKALIQFCETEARRLKLRSVQLYTNEKMTENLLIYSHLGYQETHRRCEDGFHRVFFEKLL